MYIFMISVVRRREQQTGDARMNDKETLTKPLLLICLP